VNERAARGGLALVMVIYLVLGLAYSVVNPIFESPDESLNYANIRFLIEERRFPVLKPDEPTKAHHPPLYYVLGALLTHWVPNEDFDAVTERVNPFWIHRVGEFDVDNKTLYLHDPALEGFPYRDVALGVHLVRWLSLAMGAGTVLLVYATAKELLPHRPSLWAAAAALVAFNPMFLFISGSVHDDALANLVAAAILIVTARITVRGPTMRRAVGLGGLLGLAILTKLTCLLITPTVALALLGRSSADGLRVRLRDALRFGGIIVLVALLIGGWWFARNQLLYGEPTSMGRQMEAWGGPREDAPDLAAAARELGFLHDSSWGVFGYGQIPMPRWTYALYRLLGLAALGGLLLLWARRRRGRGSGSGSPVFSQPLSLMGALIVLSAPATTFLVVFARMTFIDTADFGRYLFVSLGFLTPLYVLGIGQWLRGRRVKWLSLGMASGMVVLALFALIQVLHPAYADPEMLSTQEIQARTQPSALRFGESIRLLGHKLDRRRARPGEEVAVTLCWESLASMEEDFVYFVHFLGPEERIVGARTTHPGLGRYPTSHWSPGDRFCDVLGVPVEKRTPAPAVYNVEIGWHEPDGGERLPAYDGDGTPLEWVLLDRIKVAPEKEPTVSIPRRVDADLGGEITLLGYDVDALQVSPGDTLSVTLYWEAQVRPPVNYTVFLHLAAADGPPHAQNDGPPAGGTYPTSFWDVGEVVTDPRTIHIPADLPPGDYPLVAGMYRLETGERLPWLGVDGAVRGDAVALDTITVRPDGS
jgi:4-amino-4-deoxy-L-arabinose transferase-like glycosyltransferase